MASEAIVTEGLTKVYKGHIGRRRQRSLDSLTLSVREHEIYGFLGQNGAGKTTTIKILCGLLRPTGGAAHVFGDSVRNRASRRFIGYLPENPYFYEYLTPRETLDFYGKLHGLSVSERAEEWEKLSDLLELRDIANQRVRGFSKGMRQRLGFAVSLVGNPPILILDEPMSGLDPLGRRRIRELILRMRDEKKTIFFSSHVLGDVEQICDRVGILVKGKMRTEGRIDELIGRKVDQVEVIVSGLNGNLPPAVADYVVDFRESEAGHHLYVPDMEAANAVAKAVLELGGRLVEFNPVRESLEEYFMREQGGKP